MLAVTGASTTIVRELSSLTTEPIVRIVANLGVWDCRIELPPADRIVLAAGYLSGRALLDQGAHELQQTFAINLVNTMRLCEAALANPNVRICVIGSESGFSGSFDMAYAISKAGLHRYVEMRQVGPSQSLACIAPPIISDSGMTRRRHDYPGVLARRRTVTAERVAVDVYKVLYGPRVANAVIRP